MMRFAAFVFSLLLALPASAQVTTRPPGGTLPFSGGTITTPLLAPDGCVSPPYSFTSQPTFGLCLDTQVYVKAGSTAYAEFFSGASGGFNAVATSGAGANLNYINVDGTAGLSLQAKFGADTNRITVAPTSTSFTDPILLPDGAAATPSLSFSSETDLGCYRSAADFFLCSTGVTPSARSVLSLLGSTNARLLHFAAGGLGTWIALVDGSKRIDLVVDGTARQQIYDTANIFSVPIQVGDGTSGAPTYAFSADTTTGLYRIGAGIIGFSAAGTEALRVTTASLQGATSKTLVDATATAFVRLSVADDDYEGCGIIYTAFAEDADTDARQTRTGKTHAAILNNSGTEVAVFSTGDSAVAVTAGTLTCTFDGNSAVNNTIDLRANCDTSLDAAAETLTFQYRLDCPSSVTVTPQ